LDRGEAKGLPLREGPVPHEPCGDQAPTKRR
jgi:hypothetical protein